MKKRFNAGLGVALVSSLMVSAAVAAGPYDSQSQQSQEQKMKQSEEHMEQTKEQMEQSMDMEAQHEPGDTAQQAENADQPMESGETTAYKEDSGEEQKTSWWQFWK